MATPGYIYVADSIEDGKIVSFKCICVHYDGYLSEAGKTLATHYTDPEKVAALVALGDLSILGAEVTKPLGHSFENPVSGYCVAYGRDRQERYCEASVVPDFEMPGRFNNGRLVNTPRIESTDYIWDGSKWWCYDAGYDMAPDSIAELNAVLIKTGNV